MPHIVHKGKGYRPFLKAGKKGLLGKAEKNPTPYFTVFLSTCAHVDLKKWKERVAKKTATRRTPLQDGITSAALLYFKSLDFLALTKRRNRVPEWSGPSYPCSFFHLWRKDDTCIQGQGTRKGRGRKDKNPLKPRNRNAAVSKEAQPCRIHTCTSVNQEFCAAPRVSLKGGSQRSGSLTAVLGSCRWHFTVFLQG